MGKKIQKALLIVQGVVLVAACLVFLTCFFAALWGLL